MNANESFQRAVAKSLRIVLLYVFGVAALLSLALFCLVFTTEFLLSKIAFAFFFVCSAALSVIALGTSLIFDRVLKQFLGREERG